MMKLFSILWLALAAISASYAAPLTCGGETLSKQSQNDISTILFASAQQSEKADFSILATALNTYNHGTGVLQLKLNAVFSNLENVNVEISKATGDAQAIFNQQISSKDQTVIDVDMSALSAALNTGYYVIKVSDPDHPEIFAAKLLNIK